MAFNNTMTNILNKTTGNYNLDSESTAYESLEEMNERYASALIPLSVFLGLIGLIGVVGNIIVLVVFSLSPEYRNNTFRVFVVCLGIVDLVTCISLIPAEIAKHRTHFSFPDALPCKVKCFFNTFNTNAAAYILLIIAVDRFRKVCQPLKKQLWPELAVKILTVFVVFSFFLAMPAPIMCGISTVNKTNIYNTSTTVYMCTAEKKYQRSIWRYVYKIALTLCLLIISLCFIVMYSMIGRTVLRHWGTRAVGSSIRFDTSRSDETSDRVEADHLADDVFSPEEMRNLAIKFGVKPVEENQDKANSVHDPLNRKSSKSRKSSNVSLSFSIVKKKASFGKRGSNSRGSDASFRSNSLRRRSSTTGQGRFPYKTLIWLILTIIFIVTYFIYAILSFLVPKVYTLSPKAFVVYSFFYRLYFINNAINPIIYAWLDRRFKSSCKRIFKQLKNKLTGCCCGWKADNQ